jgi:hypothetical protein
MTLEQHEAYAQLVLSSLSKSADNRRFVRAFWPRTMDNVRCQTAACKRY